MTTIGERVKMTRKTNQRPFQNKRKLAPHREKVKACVQFDS